MIKGKNIEKAEVLFRLLAGVAKHVPSMSYYQLGILARNIGNSLFDMSPIWSGYKSQTLIDAELVNPSTKKVAEHYYPRQVAGWRIVEHLARYNGISRKKLNEFVIAFNRVHYTTAEENTRLVPHQKYGVFTTPEDSYRLAGIHLVCVKEII